MTPQEQQAFDEMRDELEFIANAIARQLDLISNRAIGEFLNKSAVVQALKSHHRRACAALNAAKAASEQPEGWNPATGPMTTDRAAYFMRRFKKEEKLLGPNEQAAVDYVIAMLEQPQAQDEGFDGRGLSDCVREKAQAMWDAQPAQKPVAWFAFGDSNGPVPLELFGWDEKACKYAVLKNARSVGWRGTLEGYLYQQGWTIKPVYTAPSIELVQPQAQGDRVQRNDPLSALSIRILVANGTVSQSDADAAFTLACEALEEEARKMNATMPWVRAKPQARKPLTTEQRKERCEKHRWMHGSQFEEAYNLGISDAEAAHGVKGGDL